MSEQPSPPHQEPAGIALLTATVKDLPLLPNSTHSLLLLNVRDTNLPEKVQAIVETDPALAAHVIRLANSAAFTGCAEVKTIGAAIHRVGPAMIVGNALQRSINKVFDPYGGLGRRLGRIAILEANLMMALATGLQPAGAIAPEVAYTQGLLHDIGHLVMALKLGKAVESFGHREIPVDRIAPLEKATFGFDHQQAGRLLANHWRFPEEITVVIGSHHFPAELRQGVPESINRTIDMLAVTDRLSRLVGENGDQQRRALGSVSGWLGTPEAKKLLAALGASPDVVVQAVPLAFAALEREERMSAAA
jgi:HD-like signal output (HDOD) protein